MGIVEIIVGVVILGGISYVVYKNVSKDSTDGTTDDNSGTSNPGGTGPVQPQKNKKQTSKETVKKIAQEPDEVVHDWTVEAFDDWWTGLSDKQKNDTLEHGATFPKGKKFPNMEDYRYWNRLAIKRATKFVYDGVEVPQGHGIAKDGTQK